MIMGTRPREHFRNDTITANGTYRSSGLVNIGVPSSRKVQVGDKFSYLGTKLQVEGINEGVAKVKIIKESPLNYFPTVWLSRKIWHSPKKGDIGEWELSHIKKVDVE